MKLITKFQYHNKSDIQIHPIYTTIKQWCLSCVLNHRTENIKGFVHKNDNNRVETESLTNTVLNVVPVCTLIVNSSFTLVSISRLHSQCLWHQNLDHYFHWFTFYRCTWKKIKIKILNIYCSSFFSIIWSLSTLHINFFW